MSSSSAPIYEGVLAINKPPAISSRQVIDDVQKHFNPSQLFHPWLVREDERKKAESNNQQSKRKWRGRRPTTLKMGHGGTLDPMATGVLILGIGSGTKQLQYFSNDCVKSYDAVLLFGAATDSYDSEGKIVSRGSYEHITKEAVSTGLRQFRGKISQKPPIFSALRVQGKRLYEYAREGKAPPIEIAERPMEVLELEMLEWMDGGTHSWHWPTTEAEKEVKEAAEKMLQPEAQSSAEKYAPDLTATAKRKREEEEVPDGTTDAPTAKKVATENEAQPQEPSEQLDPSPTDPTVAPSSETIAGAESETQTRPVEKAPCPAPACRLRMTVTSGFYVRSLCHDLGLAVGSFGIMTNLVRTKQSNFELGKNVLEYDDLAKGEDVWGPQVKQMLEDWDPVIDKKGNKQEKQSSK